MTFIRQRNWIGIAAATGTLLLVLSAISGKAQQPEAEQASAAATADFAVPDGTPEELLAFIEKVASDSPQFESRAEMVEYAQKASAAIGEAAEKILAGQPSDQQATDAVEWKVAALDGRIRIGDFAAMDEKTEFLDALAKDERPAVAKTVAREKFVMQMGSWRALTEEEQQEAVDNFVKSVQTHGVAWQDAMVASNLSMIADQGGGELAASALEELLPLFRKEADPQIQQMLPQLEGLARFINLLGNKLELEGTLLDGTPLDWESYRGKVVLVDFWATWCGPCRAEIPNVKANYRMYSQDDFEVLGISLDDSRAQAESYIEENDIRWATVFSDDPQASGWNAPMATKYAVNAIPRAILVDRDGVVVHMNARGEILGQQLRKLLGEPRPSAAQNAAEVENNES